MAQAAKRGLVVVWIGDDQLLDVHNIGDKKQVQQEEKYDKPVQFTLL